ncbi:uncharacterized protein TRIADDRAFT_54228 [Trichoplax adhaerens]|uniref:[histone H3]-lysine(36) N-trimethyltransferase n=1 Tax=Trichoplax adhaerens TaxID=10228 RepID=B3RRG4_TRIAD|nr:hypothetical protein TRIADDRAFT_54228 [Trichoplax adhaerens]EDV26870.1 hypothetical protein TRIADDRAFT_54228 [Trichoplax adhaerens]|eukprot:XP_002110866.1 hypothetical protein TRIADDRAFT_54228 [Trichoplax adhaerens]
MRFTLSYINVHYPILGNDDSGNDKATTLNKTTEDNDDKSATSNADDPLSAFNQMDINTYLSGRKSKDKRIKNMTCECTYDEDDPNFIGCGENCLNRMLFIECGSKCSCGKFCTNRRFQMAEYPKVEVFKTEKKGFGLRTLEDLEDNQFVLEYCGEVIDLREFERRKRDYAKKKIKHYYFMTLSPNEIIDASRKGTFSRFINHSCDPNCVTQKWTVNGMLRIGFFTLRKIPANTELTFDYQFERYGREVQECYCGSEKCRGYLGAPKNDSRQKDEGSAAESDGDELSEFEEEVQSLTENERGLEDVDSTLKLCRLMIRAETTEHRLRLLNVLQDSASSVYLKHFVKYHGLSLLWSWMVDSDESDIELRSEILHTLKLLPITSRNMLEDSKIMHVVKKWAQSTPVEENITVNGMTEKTVALEELPNQNSDQKTVTDENNDIQEDSSISLGKESASPSLCSASEDMPCQVNDSEADTITEVKMDIEDDTEKMTENIASSDEHIDAAITKDDASEITTVANDLLSSWSTLKEVYRIPKKVTVEEVSTPESSKSVQQKIETIISGTNSESDPVEKNSERNGSSERESRDKRDSSPPRHRYSHHNHHHEHSYRRRSYRNSSPRSSSYRRDHRSNRDRDRLHSEKRKRRSGSRDSPTRSFEDKRDRKDDHERKSGHDRNERRDEKPNKYTPSPKSSTINNDSEMKETDNQNSSVTASNHVNPPTIQPTTVYNQYPTTYAAQWQQNQMMYYQQQQQQQMAIYNQLRMFHAQQQPIPRLPAVNQVQEQQRQEMPASDPPQDSSNVEQKSLKDVPPLPPDWRAAIDQQGRIYYYNIHTRVSQWQQPTVTDVTDKIKKISSTNDSITASTEVEDHSVVKDGIQPLSPRVSTKELTSNPEVKVNTKDRIIDKKVKEEFRQKITPTIIEHLNPYRKPDCKTGHITSKEDFKALARKLSYGVLDKETKRLKPSESLRVTDSVKHRIKNFIRQYMEKCGPVYEPSKRKDDNKGVMPDME